VERKGPSLSAGPRSTTPSMRKSSKDEAAWLDAAVAVDRSKLQTALDGGNIKVVQSLLKRKNGASLASDELEDGQIPIFVAIELLGRSCGPSPRNVVDIITVLLEKRAEANTRLQPLAESPLQLVLRMDALSCVQTDVPVLRHWACMRAVVVLLEHKANPNHVDTIGEGPLAEAAVAGNLEACVLLLSHGASPSAPNENGRRPLDLDIPAAARALLEGGEDQGDSNEANYASEDPHFDDDPRMTDCSNTANAVRSPVKKEGDGFDLEYGSVEEIDDDDAQTANAVNADSSTPALDGDRAEKLPADASANVLLRQKANAHFRAREFKDAKHMYSEALKSEPDSTALWSNKAAANMMLGEFQQAFTDATEGVKNDFSHARVHERCAKCMLLLGKLDQAVRFCQLRVDHMPLEEFNSPSNGWRAYLEIANRVRHHADVISQIDDVLGDTRNSDCLSDAEKCVTSVLKMLALLGGAEMRSPWGKRLGLTKVRAMLFPHPGKSGQKREDRLAWGHQGLEEVDRLITYDPTDIGLQHWRGRCQLRVSLRAEARESFLQAVHLGKTTSADTRASQEILECLDTAESEKDKGKQAFLQGEFKVAQEHFDIAVRADRHRLDPEFSATLLCNRSTCCHKRGGQLLLCSALEDVNKALFLRPGYTKALIRRGLICMDQERYESARASFNDAAKIEPNFIGLAELQGRAKRWAAHPPRRNYYAVLRLGFDVSEAGIKKAYKNAALRWHPDKNPEDYEEASRMFKDIQEAFNVLADAKLRQAYDNLGEGMRGKFDSGGESASEQSDHRDRRYAPGAPGAPAYKTFFGASFGTAPTSGYSATGQTVDAPNQSLFAAVSKVVPDVVGPPSQLRTSKFGEGLGKGGAGRASGGTRFAGWNFDKTIGGKTSLGNSLGGIDISDLQ